MSTAVRDLPAAQRGHPTSAPVPTVARPTVRARGRPGGRILQAIPSALEALRANKGRSVLTTLGIIIGVASVIAIVALGQGSSAQVQARLSTLGTNVLTIQGGSNRGPVQGGAGTAGALKAEDAEAIRREVPNILLSPVVQGNSQVIAGSNNWQTRVTAVRPEYQQIQSWQMASGAFFTEQDDAAARNVAVLGQTVVQSLFPGGQVPVGQVIRVRNVPFTVVGVLASKGTGFGGDQDDTILIPFQTGQVRLFGISSINNVVIQAQSSEDVPTIITQVSALLRARRGLQASQANDFTVRNNNEVVETVSSVSETMTYLLGGVAAISLIVGGIGIMNIMLVSVTERTREIGIRMAIGARGSDILAQFLVESVVLSLIGGIIGILIGAAATFAIPAFLGWATVLPVGAIVLAFAFAAAVGIVFGVYPARKASRLDPIDALRYQ